MTEFKKIEGLGNKFLISGDIPKLASQEIAKLCSENHVDGLLNVTVIHDGLIKMKYWNADGSTAEMCGNGLRCVVRFAVDEKLVNPGQFVVRTDAGQLKVNWDGTDPANIEVQVGTVKMDLNPLCIYDKNFYKADVGNPHAVTFVEDTRTAPVQEIGPKVENNNEFLNKTNVEFVQILNRHAIRVRTWERGSGETQACGTGMVAAANVAVQIKNAEFPLQVEVLGGKAKVWLDDEGFTRMIGPAQYF
jgi:diaminopimelate epimerase